MSSSTSPTAESEDPLSYPDPEILPRGGYYCPTTALRDMETNDFSQAAQDSAQPRLSAYISAEQELNEKLDAAIDPALSYRPPDISAGMGVDLNNNCRALITAIRRSQRPARHYSAVRIFGIVMWEDQNPLPGQPENLKYGVLTLPAGQVVINEDPLQVWTVPKDVIPMIYLDDRAKIIWHVRAVVHEYADLAYPDFRTGLIGVYEDEVDGGPGLVLAVLMLGNLGCPSFMNTTARERGMNGLFKHEVESMLNEQFDPPILRSCILDAFARVE